MPLSSSNTGSTDLRDTEVQQPNTAATLSTVSSWRAFSANSGQLEAGSTTTGSILWPMTPPLRLISSNVMRSTSLSTDSLIAMVPEIECSTPTLTIFSNTRILGTISPLAAVAAPRASPFTNARRFMRISSFPVRTDRSPATSQLPRCCSQHPSLPQYFLQSFAVPYAH